MESHLNEKNLAKRWSISPRTLQRWRQEGKGPAYLKLGGRVVYRLAEVEAFEEQQHHKATGGARKKGRGS